MGRNIAKTYSDVRQNAADVAQRTGALGTPGTPGVFLLSTVDCLIVKAAFAASLLRPQVGATSCLRPGVEWIFGRPFRLPHWESLVYCQTVLCI